MICDFSLNHYEECLQLINLSSSYTTKMIHDVDIWTPHMHEILDLEIKYNINSIWFFRFHAKNYNLLAFENINFLEKFSELKNISCGIHIEPYYFDKFDILNEQLLILNKIIKVPIKFGSIHEPTRFPYKCIHTNLTIINYINCKNNNIKYISDSSSHWREGCMCKHINKNNLVILTHPNWWYKKYSGEIY